MIGTSCRFCEFRTNDENGKQTGCELGLVDLFVKKYENNEVKVEDHVVDDERGHDEFKTLPTLCLYRRMPGWKQAMRDKVGEDVSFKDIARSELTLKVTAVLFLDEEQTMQDLIDTINVLEKMELPPVKLVIVNWSKHVKPHQFISLLRNHVKIPWAMETVLESRQELPPGYNDGENLIERRAFDLGAKKVDTPFFIALKVGTEVPSDFIQSQEHHIIDKMEGVVMQEATTINGPHFYQTTVYKIVGGNKERPVGDKIRNIAEEQECQNLIRA